MVKSRKKWNRFIYISAFLLASVYAAVIFPHPNGLVIAQGRPSIDVTIQVFSGLLNPGWVVKNPNQIARLRELTEGLPEAEPVDDLSGAFILRSDEPVPGFHQRVVVYKERVIKVRDADGNTEYFQDTKGLRNLLVKEARKRGISIPRNLR